jgi:alkaline phosphatase D
VPASSLNRRQFLRAGTAAGVSLAAFPRSAPAFLRSRRKLAHGIQSGDVTADAGIVWARADRPSRMLIEVATTPRFDHARTLRGPILTPDHDLAGRILVDDLPAGQQIFYRVTLEDLYSQKARSEPAVGSFTTAPRKRRDVSFTWSGDLAGQAGGSTPTSAATGSSRRWLASSPTSCSAAATPSTPTAR